MSIVPSSACTRLLRLLPLSLAFSAAILVLPVGCADGGDASSESPVADSPATEDLPSSADEKADMQPADSPQYPPAPEGKVLRHAVFFSFKEDSSEDDIAGVVDAFRELPSKISEITDFQWGTNNSPEGLNDGFTHCFLLTFKDEAGRAAYLPHEDHKAFGDVLRPHMDKVFVIDYWGKADQPKLDKELKHAVLIDVFHLTGDVPVVGAIDVAGVVWVVRDGHDARVFP